MHNDTLSFLSKNNITHDELYIYIKNEIIQQVFDKMTAGKEVLG